MGPSDLPDFDEPPVVEVALSVQFEPLVGLRSPQMGLFWQGLREEFPKVEEQAPLEDQMETFGEISPPRVEIRLEQRPPVPRWWLLNKEGTELIQVQQSRLAHNWRKTGPSTRYPRYESIREKFRREMEMFQGFLDREGLGSMAPNQCEVTYVNHLEARKGWDHFGQVENVLSVWAPNYSDGFLGDAENVEVWTKYRIPDASGNPIGRLHVELRPAYRQEDKVQIFFLRLIARAKPVDSTIQGVLSFMDLGRDWIVRGFTSITTPAMHKIWRRKI